MEFNIVNKTLSIENVIRFINEVVDAYFTKDENGEIVSYEHYLGELAFKNAFLKYYTDYEHSGNTDDDYLNISDFNVNMFVYEETDHTFNLVQYKDIITSIEKQVSVKKKIFIDSQNGITKFINTLTNKINEFNIDTSITQEFMKKFSESDFSAKSIMDEYLKSETHDKKVINLLNSKNEQISMLKNQVKSEVVKDLKNEFTARNVKA